MGSSTSLESVVDIDQVLNKPITDTTPDELISLLKYYSFDDKDKKLATIIKKKEISGALFESLVKKVVENNELAVEDERDRLAGRLATRYSVSESLMTRFIQNIIIRKINNDVANASTKKLGISSGPFTTSTIITDSDTPNSPTNYNISTAYDEKKLNDWEKEGIKKINPRLTDYYKFLKEKNKKFEDSNLCGDLEVDAQNMVCKDRFMFNTFCAPILTNLKRRVISEAPKIQVKLIISEIDGNELYRSIVSKVVDTPFGILHTGLLFGEWKFDWYDNSMVSVKRSKNIGSGNAIAVVDLGSLTDQNSILNAFIKISDIVCKYNATMEYSQLKCNCQHFVSEILDALSLVTPKSTCFQKYFKNLKKGDMARKFYFGPGLYEKLLQGPNAIYQNKKSVKFESRKDLDQFCFYIQELGHFTTEEGKDDYMLLKSFDRSFVISGKREGLTVVDYNVEGFKKQNAFFSLTGTGLFDDCSIIHIVYNVGDMDLTKYYLKR